MKFFCIRHSLTIDNALVMYNKRRKTKFQKKDLRVIYIMSTFQMPIKRSKILDRLASISHIMNYKQLNQCLVFLQVEGLVKREITSSNKFSITPSGLIFLLTIEEWTRKFRLDRIKAH